MLSHDPSPHAHGFILFEVNIYLIADSNKNHLETQAFLTLFY